MFSKVFSCCNISYIFTTVSVKYNINNLVSLKYSNNLKRILLLFLTKYTYQCSDAIAAEDGAQVRAVFKVAASHQLC